MYPIHLPDNNDAKCNNKNYVCDYKQYYNNELNHFGRCSYTFLL